MREQLGEQPDSFYFDEASRMFIRRGEKPPSAGPRDPDAESIQDQRRSEERRPLPDDLRQLTVEELADLPVWMVPPARLKEVELLKARQHREARLQLGHNDVAVPKSTEQPGWMPSPSDIRIGPRGGRYTDARTKEGRPYRRYF